MISARPVAKDWRLTGVPISARFTIRPDELVFSQIRAQGPGGQHVNKTSSAIHLRYNLHNAALPDEAKQRLLQMNDQRISSDGTIVIKSQDSRSAEQNRLTALVRLQSLLRSALVQPKPRRATKPTRASKHKRMDKKSQRGKVKQMRGKVVV